MPAPERGALSTHLSSHRIVIARAVLALIWAAAVVVAIGDRVPTTDAQIPVAAAALLAAYPLIDVAASLAGAYRRPDATPLKRQTLAGGRRSDRLAPSRRHADRVRWWAVISAPSVRVALAGLAGAMYSGGLSTLAGVSFLSAAGMHDAHLAVLGGYMAVGAVLYLVSTRRRRATESLAG